MNKIEKYAIYASRIGPDQPWYWWARAPWSVAIRFDTWTRAAGYLALHHSLRQKERS